MNFISLPLTENWILAYNKGFLEAEIQNKFMLFEFQPLKNCKVNVDLVCSALWGIKDVFLSWNNEEVYMVQIMRRTCYQ